MNDLVDPRVVWQGYGVEVQHTWNGSRCVSLAEMKAVWNGVSKRVAPGGNDSYFPLSPLICRPALVYVSTIPVHASGHLVLEDPSARWEFDWIDFGTRAPVLESPAVLAPGSTAVFRIPGVADATFEAVRLLPAACQCSLDQPFGVMGGALVVNIPSNVTLPARLEVDFAHEPGTLTCPAGVTCVVDAGSTRGTASFTISN